MREEQEDQESGLDSSELVTAREAAKAFMRPYMLDGWQWQELSRKQPHTDRPEFAAQVGGSKVIDHQGEPRTISREQIAVTRVGSASCLALFDLAEILAELRDEQRGYSQLTLAAIFAQEQERLAQAQREDEDVLRAIAPQAQQSKRPAIFRAYQGGFCRNCGESLGYIEADGGRTREFCDNNGRCRVAYHRAKRREEERTRILQYHGELRAYWQENGIHGEVLLRLHEILFRHGKQAARAATDAVLVALAANEQAGSNEQMRLIEECMLGGEAIGFEEIILEDFRIPAGVAGWSEFVTYATNPLLRQLRGYLYERVQREQQKVQGRKRLTELSHNSD